MHNVEKERVVITAFGCSTPLGTNYNEIKKALEQGASGIKENEKFDCTNFIIKHAGIPDEGNEKIHWPSKKRAEVGEFFYADLAAKRLRTHPLFPNNFYPSEKIGCVIGVDEPAVDVQLCFELFNGYSKTNDDLKKRLTDVFRLQDFLNISASNVLGVIHKVVPFSGYSKCHIGLCSASLQAIGMGVNAIRSGTVDAAIVGGVSGKVNPLNQARLELIGAISLDETLSPQERSRPFDSKRSGFVLGEGSVLFLLEKIGNVKKRKERGLLEILGYGSSLSAQHIIAPHTDSLEMKLAMERAINDSGVNCEDIDLINAHGTSTVLNDYHESKAIEEIFGNRAGLKVTANKSLHGHMIAAAGAMEVLNTLISVNEGFIPPTINLDEKDSRCDINIATKPEKASIKTVLKNSFGMGGLAASMVLKKLVA